MMMYHSWDAQNAWLRQIIAENALYMNARTARELGLADGDWVWLESTHGKLRCRIRTMEGVEPSTVWTWNAIGKQGGAWGLAADAPEATTGFLLNHLISRASAEARRRRSPHHQLRSDHRPGGVVRPARAADEMRERRAWDGALRAAARATPPRVARPAVLRWPA